MSFMIKRWSCTPTFLKVVECNLLPVNGGLNVFKTCKSGSRSGRVQLSDYHQAAREKEKLSTFLTLKVKRRYRHLKSKVHCKVQQLQQQRLEQLEPARLSLPAPWEPVLFTQPTCMYMMMEAHDGQFVSLYDKNARFRPQSWTYGPADCQGAWPPLWGCMPTYPTAAQVMSRVHVSGKGYTHPDGRVAVAALLLDEVLEYVPQRPKERIIDVEY